MYSTYKIQIIFESKDRTRNKTVIVDKGEVPLAKTIEDVGLRHSKQLDILQSIQDEVLEAQSPQFIDKNDTCPNCGNKMGRAGVGKSSFHSVFLDHKVTILKQRCFECGKGSVPSIKSLFGTAMHPDLAKMQSQFGADHSYRKAQNMLDTISAKRRSVNSHESIKNVVEKVGNYIGETLLTTPTSNTEDAKELILQVDGGHIKSSQKDKRSFEAMASIVYRPENNIKDKSGVGKIINKTCVSSALESDDFIKQATVRACEKQGISSSTVVVAICDGATNCWNVVDSIAGKCREIIKILDWFHIAKKVQNIALGKLQQKLLEKVKWCLWHGNAEDGLKRLGKLIEKVKSITSKNRLLKLETYITNNKNNIINYEEYKNAGKVFTSQVAESTIESMINQRCKGHKHMQWCRKGVHPVLQMRSYMASNGNAINDNEIILKAITKAA